MKKAKWFNHEWIKKADAGSLKADVRRILGEHGISNIDDAQLEKVITLVKERCTLLSDFTEQAGFFFQTPKHWDVDAIKPKWNEAKQTFFGDVITYLQQQTNWNSADLEHGFKELATAKQIKAGEVLLPLRIMLVGGKFGPGVFDIASIIGKEETIGRIKKVLELL